MTSVERSRKQAPTQQLELPFINSTGAPLADKGCKTVTLLLKPVLTQAETAYLAKVAIPGLDATFCRCEECSRRSRNGIWWFDAQMRQRVLKRITAFDALNKSGSESGDLCRDKE